MKPPPGAKWPPPPLRRESSVDGGNAWYIVTRAHDHVWRDYSAARLLEQLSMLILTGLSPEEREKVLPAEY